MSQETALDAGFSALADPTRRAILARLAHGEATANDLGRSFQLRQPTISKHLSVLERAGLISRRRDAQRRPCRLEPNGLRQLADWIGTYRYFWDDSFGRLDDYLKELATKGEHK